MWEGSECREKEANSGQFLGGDTVTRSSKVSITKYHNIDEQNATECGSEFLATDSDNPVGLFN